MRSSGIGTSTREDHSGDSAPSKTRDRERSDMKPTIGSCLITVRGGATMMRGNTIMAVCASMALALVSWPANVHAQLQPVGAELCTLAGIGCPGPQGPAGPAGPSGPSGPSGGFDTGKLYSKRCANTGSCLCDAGDFALSGGGQCQVADFIEISTCVDSPPPAAPCIGWVIECHTPAGAFVEPEFSSVVCTKP